MSCVLDREFLRHLETIHHPESGREAPRLKWYITAVLALGGMNYAEIIPELYKVLLAEYIPKEHDANETRKIREALTRVCGIWGAAKVRFTP